jgi:hypothetical protein
MKDVKLVYDSLLNEHRNLTNQIADIKAQSFELNDNEKMKIKELRVRQIQVMNQMIVLFNGKPNI